MFNARWRVINFLSQLEVVIAPQGSAKHKLERALEDYSDRIIATVALSEYEKTIRK